MKNIEKIVEFCKAYKKEYIIAPRQSEIAQEFGWSRQYVSNMFTSNKDVLSEFPEYKAVYFKK